MLVNGASGRTLEIEWVYHPHFDDERLGLMRVIRCRECDRWHGGMRDATGFSADGSTTTCARFQ